MGVGLTHIAMLPHVMCVNSCQQWMHGALPQLLVRGMGTAAMAGVAVPLLRGCWQVYRSKYDTAQTSDVIDGSLLPIGLGMILMATLA